MRRIRPESIAFGKMEDPVAVVIAVAPDGNSELPSRASMYSRELTSGETYDISKIAPAYDCISDRSKASGYLHEGAVHGTLRAPSLGQKEVAHVVQVGWPPAEKSWDQTFSRPFIVRLKRDGDSVTASVDGLKNLNEANVAAESRVRSLTLEARARDMMEIAGGRELLVQFESAPYWKRFSIERKDWLPLPPINPSVVDLTGDLSSIYALDRGAAVVRKYALEDLRLLAEVKLPTTNTTYVGIRAGCNTRNGPVMVIATDQVIALSPDKLQRVDSSIPPDRRSLARTSDPASPQTIGVSGDGHVVFGARVPEGVQVFNGEYLRIEKRPLGIDYAPSAATVSSAFSFDGSGWLTSCINGSGKSEVTSPKPEQQRMTELHYTFPNAPVGVILRFPKAATIPPTHAKAELYGLFSKEPFAVVDLPEFEKVERFNSYKRDTVQFTFDPHMMTLGVLLPDRKTWVLHDVKSVPNAAPVLLNWPDPHIERGGEFRFAAKYSNQAEITATVTRGGARTPVAVSGNDLILKIAPDELASIALLEVVARAGDVETACKIPLHVRGPILPFVRGPEAPKVSNLSGVTFKSVAEPGGTVKTLNSRFYLSNDPIKEAIGPIGGHLALVMEDGRVDFLSIATLKVARSIRTPKEAAHYGGADGLLSYVPATRVLTHYGVADPSRDRSLTIPSGQSVTAIGVGSISGSPLTLLLERRSDERSAQIGDVIVTSWNRNFGISVLSSETLQPGAWPAPKFFDSNDAGAFGAGFGFAGISGRPVRLAGSRNGQLLTLPKHLLVLTPGFSVGVPYGPGSEANIYGGDAMGSITGIYGASRDNTFSKNGVLITDPQTLAWIANSPCGRYKLQKSIDPEDRAVEVCTLDTRDRILRINRLVGYDEDFNQERGREMQFLGDGGPLLAIGGGRRVLQFVDFDVPKLAAEVDPASFHVTSQPGPLVFAGGTYEYQVAVNNPAALASYKLLQAVPGLTLSETGLARYVAPATLTQPTRIDIDIQLVNKNGAHIRHQFPLLVVPRTVPGQIPGVRLGSGGR